MKVSQSMCFTDGCSIYMTVKSDRKIEDTVLKLMEEPSDIYNAVSTGFQASISEQGSPRGRGMSCSASQEIEKGRAADISNTFPQLHLSTQTGAPLTDLKSVW